MKKCEAMSAFRKTLPAQFFLGLLAFGIFYLVYYPAGTKEKAQHYVLKQCIW
jgi:hypothetical protein